MSTFDARVVDGTSPLIGLNSYTELQHARGTAGMAIGALQKYQNNGARPLIGELFALQGYMVLMLAEGFCAGVPLSTVTFNGDISVSEGLSTEQLLLRAAALFDSARNYTPEDSLRLATLVKVGAARTQLNLGKYAAAATLIRDIPIQADYRMSYSAVDLNAVHWSSTARYGNTWLPAQILNSEGGNGLQWIGSPIDPENTRVPVGTGGTQQKFLNATSVSFANGIEAQLILAEAQLYENHGESGAWLRTLNTLRASQLSPTGDRLLQDLADPETAQGRIDLLFAERAFWMFATGHRQGDLRRLIRLYGRQPSEVYPWGDYTIPLVAAQYSTEVVLPLVETSVTNENNPGCYDTNP